MKYGCRAHDYGCFTAQELARTLADQGYNAAQLAMPKAIRGIADMNGISPEQLEEIRTAFAEADVEITVLSCYRDLSSPDDGTRTAAVADVCRALHYQKETGAKQVGSESSCRFLSEEQKAAELPLLTDSILRIVEQAAKLDACFALEPVFVHALDTVEKRRGKEFISVEEFSMCCNKLSKTHIEQLRALENGYRIKVIKTPYRFVGVDTTEDLEKVNAIYRQMQG